MSTQHKKKEKVISALNLKLFRVKLGSACANRKLIARLKVILISILLLNSAESGHCPGKV